MSFRPLAGLSCINRKGKSIYVPNQRLTFPSPRGVELHKPKAVTALIAKSTMGFRPLAGLSCINLLDTETTTYLGRKRFPSPRGVELHKP